MTVMEKVCTSCRANFHDECSLGWLEVLNDEQVCCCGGSYNTLEHLAQIIDEETMLADADGYPAPSLPAKLEHNRGKSGYIAQAAWGTTRDIGTLKDAASTGRKRAADMYPISAGQVCEWARLKNCGGGVEPIIGCLGNPASDIHHGPDKNTLNNEKMTRGIGDSENLHLICSACHNLYHAKNDGYYPTFDRNLQQAEPWLPEGEWTLHAPVEASFEELVQQEKERDVDVKNRGKATRGRNSGPRTSGDFRIYNEED